MGAWGVEPFENDTAAEFADKLRAVTFTGLRSRDPLVVRAAAEAMLLLDAAGLHVGKDFFQDAKYRLQEMIEDERFVSSWNEPRAILASLRRQLKRVAARGYR